MTITTRDRTLLRLSTAIVLGRWDELRRLRAAAGPGEPDRAWREAVLQTHVFAGFPRLVQAYQELAALGGLGPPASGEKEAEDDPAGRGRALFERIYAADAPRIRALLDESDPLFASWVAEHAYGRVLSRPGLSADRRELLAVCALAALGQGRQLASHARGALRCGATAAEVTEALECVADIIDTEDLERARAVVARFAP
ncbi:MAG: carboxymuconolactone decarboxylase family protein [Planctomycetota bacterium]|jgi:alkylhydroperoxidase/carboxymuconolactone decarboxylase family protein YurZ|nr:carboxymuconolactone decarboxylase family protein [Planctomycetota bacterium]MDP6762402.1 carboxymuconolactone decarboxylase family protein [Planctomycetota bacterium]MDP6988716.1 carboxymuconolactone decarboxylase family protein [Planctomycetota bacterium]